LATRKAPSASAANASRSSIIAGGEKSRTATLMKRYDAPQIAARRPIKKPYERVIPGRYRRRPGLHWPPDAGCGTTSAPRARTHGSRVRANRGASRTRAEPLRARGLLAALVRALRLQALGPAAEAAAVGGRGRPPEAGRE